MNLAPLAGSIAGLFNRSAPIYSADDEASLLALAHIHRKNQMEEIARPMRELFDQLATGEVFLVDGQASMRLPELDPIARLADETEWVAVAPCIRGWIDCWKRLAPRLNLQRMQYVADRLDQGKDVTPRLVEHARAEFEQTITRLHDMPDGAIKQAITTTQIGWEVDRLLGRQA